MPDSVVDQPDLADLVRKIRQQLALSQEKFAARLGVSFQTVNRWENGRTRPSPLALRQLEDLWVEMEDRGSSLLQKYFQEWPNHDCG